MLRKMWWAEAFRLALASGFFRLDQRLDVKHNGGYADEPSDDERDDVLCGP